MKKYIFLSLAIVLTGCATPDTPDVVTTKTRYIPLPDFYLDDCTIPPPPDQEKYLTLSYHEKEKTMVNIYLDTLSSVVQCNTRLASARDYQNKLKELYNMEDSHDSQELSQNYPK